MAEPIRTSVVRYRCPHCGFLRGHKADAVAHMERCWYDPGKRGCKTCVNHFRLLADPFVGAPGGDHCDAGLDIPVGDAFPASECPSWQPREGYRGGETS